MSRLPDSVSPVVLAICDVLVRKALEKVGMYQLKADRSRFKEASGQSLASIHTLYPATDEIVVKVTRGAWDILPVLLEEHSPAGNFDYPGMAKALEAYVQDLAITGKDPDLVELTYRLEKLRSLSTLESVD